MTAGDGCGGCRGLGAHRRECPNNPDYHPWRALADSAERVGDMIGSNDTGLANRADALASEIRTAIAEHRLQRLRQMGDA